MVAEAEWIPALALALDNYVAENAAYASRLDMGERGERMKLVRALTLARNIPGGPVRCMTQPSGRG